MQHSPGHKLVGLSVRFSTAAEDRKGEHTQHTPPSSIRRVSEQTAGPKQPSSTGLDIDEIASRVFNSVKFNHDDTVVYDGHCFVAVHDERLRGQLFRLFGPRLSVRELESNIDNLERGQWGWLESRESTTIDLSQTVAHQRVADLCVLACSSLSPAIVGAVSSVLTTLADSLRSVQSLLTRTSVEVNVFSRAGPGSLILVNSRLSVFQRNSVLMLCLCGASRLGMSMSLEIRRIGFSSLFTDLLRANSPMVQVRDGRVLLPPIHESSRAVSAPAGLSTRYRVSSRACSQPGTPTKDADDRADEVELPEVI